MSSNEVRIYTPNFNNDNIDLLICHVKLKNCCKELFK